MFRRFAALAALVCLASTASLAQEDGVGAPGPIVFEGTSFDLVWTSHPDATYYKQEYVPAGQAVEAYDEMFLIDVLTNGLTAEAAASSMIETLKQRQAVDPVVNFAMVANDATGELILDFLMSDDSSGTVIVEWNAYRYVPLSNGVAVFGISRRGYDEGASGFIGGLKDWRMGAIEELAGMDLPELTVE